MNAIRKLFARLLRTCVAVGSFTVGLALSFGAVGLVNGARPVDAEPASQTGTDAAKQQSNQQKAQKLVVDDKAESLLDAFARAHAQLQSATFELKKVERLRSGEVVRERQLVKTKDPGLIYLKQPDSGQEVIYNPLEDKEELTAHPGSFPDITVSIDVEGGMALSNQHHPVYHTGFERTLEILQSAMNAARAEPAGEKLLYRGEETINGRPADKVVLLAGKRKPRRVAAKESETLFDFGPRVGQDPYVIFYYNRSIDDFEDWLEAGKKYEVPAYYAERSVLWFDKETHLPVKQVMYDRQGRVYEDYEYLDVRVNPGLTAKDFDPDNPNYDF